MSDGMTTQAYLVHFSDRVFNGLVRGIEDLTLDEFLDEKWGLPKVDQGTGMDPEVAHALRFPEAERLAQYGRDVRDAVLSRVEAMSDEYLQTLNRVVPWGEITRLEAIGQTIISHGNGHLGQIDLARTMLGKPGLGI